MTEKKPTITSLKREIERLKARLEAAEKAFDRHIDAYRENLYDSVDAQIKIRQAIAILTGVDE